MRSLERIGKWIDDQMGTIALIAVLLMIVALLFGCQPNHLGASARPS